MTKDASLSLGKSVLLSVLVLLIGALAVFVIFSTEPSAERGGAVKKREETHRMAEANKAFSHYRW